VVRRGDVLGRIASSYGVTVREIQRVNNLRGTIIHPGQRLVVPVLSYSTTAVADAQPVSVQYGLRQVRPIAPPSSEPPATEPGTRQPPVVLLDDDAFRDVGVLPHPGPETRVISQTQVIS
jgi:hypothetical protein